MYLATGNIRKGPGKPKNNRKLYRITENFNTYHCRSYMDLSLWYSCIWNEFTSCQLLVKNFVKLINWFIVTRAGARITQSRRHLNKVLLSFTENDSGFSRSSRHLPCEGGGGCCGPAVWRREHRRWLPRARLPSRIPDDLPAASEGRRRAALSEATLCPWR